MKPHLLEGAYSAWLSPIEQITGLAGIDQPNEILDYERAFLLVIEKQAVF